LGKSSISNSSYQFHSLQVDNYNDSDIESANRTNSKSHSSEPLTQKLFSVSNSQPDSRSNDTKDGGIRNSVHIKGKRDLKIYDAIALLV
jgi:hypothetical protein